MTIFRRIASLASVVAVLCVALPLWANDLGNSTWNEIDASNNAASPNGWTSGSMTPSQVEPTARAMMGAIRRWYDHSQPTITSGGTANAQTLTYAAAPAAYVSGDRYAFIVGATNTGAATLNINSLGAKAVQVGGVALSGGELIAGKAIQLYYDGTQFQILPHPARMEITQDLGTALADNRWNIINTKLSAASPTSNIWENLNSFVEWSSGTANAEINVAHAFFQNDTGATAKQVETFESSASNAGILGGVEFDNYLAIITNTPTGTVPGGINGIKFALAQQNVTGGAVAIYNAIDMEAMSGGGSVPGFYNVLRNAEPLASIVTLGKMSIGTLSPPGSTQQVLVQGADNSAGTFPLTIKNLAGTNVLVVANDGTLITALPTIGTGTGKGLVCIDAATGTLYRGTGATCS